MTATQRGPSSWGQESELTTPSIWQSHLASQVDVPPPPVALSSLLGLSSQPLTDRTGSPRPVLRGESSPASHNLTGLGLVLQSGGSCSSLLSFPCQKSPLFSSLSRGHLSPGSSQDRTGWGNEGELTECWSPELEFSGVWGSHTPSLPEAVPAAHMLWITGEALWYHVGVSLEKDHLRSPFRALSKVQQLPSMELTQGNPELERLKIETVLGKGQPECGRDTEMQDVWGGRDGLLPGFPRTHPGFLVPPFFFACLCQAIWQNHIFPPCPSWDH